MIAIIAKNKLRWLTAILLTEIKNIVFLGTI
jgi:hypothetical protein